MNTNTHVIIMAGGIGSRFWPLSTPAYPKQFVDVMGVGKSLIQLTAERFQEICSPERMWVVTNQAYVDMVKDHLPQVPAGNILAEPAARNTAPCIAYACWKIKEQYPTANIVVTPSDALVLDVPEFRRVIQRALDFTENRTAIVTVGIQPNRPETGYGYIQATDVQTAEEVWKVQSFREKPNRETAMKYVEDGHYFWNAGIFVWNIRTIVAELRKHVPALCTQMDEMAEGFGTEQEAETVTRIFPTCEKISIDYAVMEKAECIYTIPADFGWSDLGNWASLYGLLQKDEAGNAAIGKVSMYECRDCVVQTAEAKSVVLQGLDGYIVAEKNGRILVCKRSEEQRIKDFEKG
ncbi:mannose-1-phosphate guanylyltransferase [uncultured Bacteroides sp.]|uniref:mannose-1-phosphate guanylyltransferase n=1 Tax=uncultured Bacteroides sp. TaxID=162156 RepID=UPI0026392E53|nr:mannose-1-phosphate guanylyltransferase [uncultured Bacteroides sp.]